MRKYLVSIALFGLICPMGYLAWSSSSRRANAQAGLETATAPTNDAAAMAGQIQKLQQDVQALQNESRLTLTLPPGLADAAEDQSVITVSEPGAGAKRKAIEAALESPTTLEFVDTPLKEVVDYLKDYHHIEIQLDLSALKDAGTEPDANVSKSPKGISLRSVLRLVLDDLQLKYVIRNEVLLITSPSKAVSDECMTTCVYPVKDLIQIRKENGTIKADYRPLTDTITQTIATKTWQDNGGNGTLSPLIVKGRCLLAVTQTQEVHEDLAAFFTALRSAGDPNLKTAVVAPQPPAAAATAPRKAKPVLKPNPPEKGGKPAKDPFEANPFGS